MIRNSTIIPKDQVHPKTKHGFSRRSGISPTYAAWKSMKYRCNCPSFIGYKDYGGRGIKVCDRWLHSFENFLADMGERPSKNYSLDRYPDVNGDYEPSNCRWAERKAQNSNTRRNVFIEYKGETKTAAEWARLIGITQAHLKDHLEKRTFAETVEFFRKKGRLKYAL